MSATNAHILINLARTRQLNHLLDSGQLREDDILSHPLARPIPAAEFRHALFKSLAGKGPKLGPPKCLRFFSRGYHSKRHYRLKTSRIYFTKNRTAHTPWVSEAVIGCQSNTTRSSHHLERMEKRRECSICRYDFRNGNRNGRRRPTLTHFECSTCSPPSALCGGDMPCFSRWHGFLELS